MASIIKDEDFQKVGDSVRPDTRKRVVLPGTAVAQGITYHIYRNRAGQIILDPQVTIPASELWLFKNKQAFEMVDKGMTEEGLVNRGSFAKYVKDESEAAV